VGSAYAKESHMNLIVLNDGHSGNSQLITCACLDFLAITSVYLADNGVNPWNSLTDKVDIPLLQRFSHNGMVGVSKGICNNVPALIPAIAAIVQKNTHKLGYSEGGVGVVNVYSNLFIEIIQSAVNGHMPVYNIPYRSGTHEILLS